MSIDRERVREHLVDYVDGTLPPEARREVDAALADDSALAAEVADLREAIRLASTLATPIDPPRDLEARVRSAVDGSTRSVVRWVVTGGAGLAAAAMLVFALGGPYGADDPSRDSVRVEAKSPEGETLGRRNLQHDFDRFEPKGSGPEAEEEEAEAPREPAAVAKSSDAPAPAAPVARPTPGAVDGGARRLRGQPGQPGPARGGGKKTEASPGADEPVQWGHNRVSADAAVVEVTIACPVTARPSVIEALVRTIVERRLATSAVRLKDGLALRVDVPATARAALLRALTEAGATGGWPTPAIDGAWLVRIPTR